MATTTVSIGSNQSIDTETPASTVTSSDPNYTITFSSNPNSTVAVGDIIQILADVGSDNTPSSSSGSDPYTVSFSNSVNSAVGIGARFYITDPTSGDTYRYDVTNVSGSDYTLDYISGASSAAPPTDIVDEYGDQVDGRFYALNTYLLIEINGNNYKFKYCTGVSSASPFGLQTNGSQSTATFKRAFSTITLFEAMVDDASPDYWGSSDDVVGELHADSTFTDATVNFNQKQSLSSVTLSVYEDDRHDGTAEHGALWKPTSGSGLDQGIIRINIDNMTVEWLDISFHELDSTNSNKAIVLVGTNDDNIIRNNLIHDKDGNPGTNGAFMIHVIGAGASTDTLTIQNNIIYNIVETDNDNSMAINTNQWAGTVNIYNNTIYNIDAHGNSKQAWGIVYGNVASAVINIKNNIVAKMVADHVASNERAYQKFNASSTQNASNNLSDDTTTTAAYKAPGTDSLQDKTLSEIAFVSTSPGSEDLHLGTGSVCLKAGVDLGTTNNVNIDIDGLDRDATGVTWDIGADQKSTADSGSAGKAFLIFLDI